MAEHLKLVSPTKLDKAGMDAFVRQLNLRLDQLAKRFEQSDKVPALKANLDAGNHRLTNIGRALSVDDALPLGQLAEALEELEDDVEPTSEGEDLATGGRNRRTSRRRRETEDQIAGQIADAAADAAPPPVATASALGTTLDPIQFALEDHTHAGIAVLRKNSAGGEFARRRVNVIEGSNITITMTDDAGNDEIDLTIAASAAGATVNKNSLSITTAQVADRVDRSIVDANCLVTSVVLAQARSLTDPDAEAFDVVVYNIANGGFDIGVVSLDGPYDFSNGYQLQYIIAN